MSDLIHFSDVLPGAKPTKRLIEALRGVLEAAMAEYYENPGESSRGMVYAMVEYEAARAETPSI